MSGVTNLCFYLVGDCKYYTCKERGVIFLKSICQFVGKVTYRPYFLTLNKTRKSRQRRSAKFFINIQLHRKASNETGTFAERY